jgi:hypothetical protein
MRTFGKATKEMSVGERVRRSGWNGKGMYIYIVKQELQYPPTSNGDIWKGGIFPPSTFIVMKTADDKLIP